jgi:hypothetical protein
MVVASGTFVISWLAYFALEWRAMADVGGTVAWIAWATLVFGVLGGLAMFCVGLCVVLLALDHGRAIARMLVRGAAGTVGGVDGGV